MIDSLASDVAVTWLGAAGCVLYAQFLWQQRAAGFAARATQFLVALLAWVLFVRGFYWLWPGEALGRLVFAGATLLPLGITLFSEGLARRHQPLVLKLFAVAVCAVFGAANLFFDLVGSPPLLMAFCACLAMSALTSAGFLWGAPDLSHNEAKLARSMVVAGLLAVPLITTDFREELGHVPVRLGAIAALLFISVHVGLSGERGGLAGLFGRLTAALAAAVLLAGIFALAMGTFHASLLQAALHGFPVAFAWVLLTAVFLQVHAASLEGRDAGFLRWLARARLDSASGFFASLRWLPQMRDYVVLEEGALSEYAIETIFAVVGREPVSLGEARRWAARPGVKREAGEQLRDLLERHGMTHALLVSPAPALVVLLNLPSGALASLGALRASVIQHLARRLARG